MKRLLFLFLPLMLYGNIPERDGQDTYRVDIPGSWQKTPPLSSEQLTDTKQANCTFFVEKIRVTIHTFPSLALEDRISPQAQIVRWKQQFEKLEPQSITITPQAFSGYAGLLFEGTGMLQGEHTTMMAWSMQLAPEHYRHLQYRKPEAIRSDFTIKATGPVAMMAMYRSQLIQCARSFERIEEFPED